MTSMVEKEISILIRRLKDIIVFLKPLIVRQKEIQSFIDDKIKEIKTHHFDCNIARSVGTGVSTAGSAAALLSTNAVLKSSGSPVIIGIGVAVMVLGKLASLITDIVDEVKSKNFIKDVKEVVASENDLAEKLRENLDKFQQFLKTIQSSRSKEMLEDTGLNVEERFEGHQSSLVLSHSDICGDMSTDIDFAKLVNGFNGKFDEVTMLVNTVKMSEILLPSVVAALKAIGALKEIDKVIQGWKSKHPTEEAFLQIRQRLTNSISTLQRLLKDIEENVELLEEKITIIKAIEAYEKINLLLESSISTQEKAVNWIQKKLATMAMTHRIGCFLIMVTIMCVFTVIFNDALELGLLGEIRFGVFGTIFTGLSIAIFAAIIKDKFFRLFEKDLEKRLRDHKCPIHKLRKELSEINEHPMLKHLLDSDDKTIDDLEIECFKEKNKQYPDKIKPISETAKAIAVNIRRVMKKSITPRSSAMGGFFAETLTILEAIYTLDDIRSSIDYWAIKNRIQKELVSPQPDGLDIYIESIEKLLGTYKEDCC